MRAVLSSILILGASVTFACAQPSDDAAIAASGGKAKRTGKVLSLKLENGKTLELKDQVKEGDDAVYFRYAALLEPIGYYYIQEAYYEGQGWSLVNAKNGTKYILCGEPVVSPDGKWVACGNADLVAAFDPNGIEVWKVEANKLNRVFHQEPEDWGAEALRWQDERTVKFARVVQDEKAPGNLKRGKRFLVLDNNGSWKIEKKPGDS